VRKMARHVHAMRRLQEFFSLSQLLGKTALNLLDDNQVTV
jgi:hypothetical protein